VDISAPADHAIRVTRFDYYAGVPWSAVTPYPTMDVWVHTAGSYIGHSYYTPGCSTQYNPDGWAFNTQVTTKPYPMGGSFAPLAVTLSTPVDIPAGQTVGFYMITRSGGQRVSATASSFSDGSTLVFSDRGRFGNGLQTTGPMWNQPFFATQWTFNGRVYYTTVPTGLCCRGSTCNANVSQANCTPVGLAGAKFVGSTSTCNASGNTISPCCYADFNKTNGLGVQDIFDFLNAWFGGSPYAKFAGDGTSTALSVQDIFDFLNAWFSGGC
jgi:hypothetical protein